MKRALTAVWPHLQDAFALTELRPVQGQSLLIPAPAGHQGTACLGIRPLGAPRASREMVSCLFLTRLFHFAFRTPALIPVEARDEISARFKADNGPLSGGTAFCSPGWCHPLGSCA